MAKGKCKYYRESPIETYTPECVGDSQSVHPDDTDTPRCQFCGRKIKLKEYTSVPDSLLEDFYS